MTASVDPTTSALAELQAFGLLVDRLELGPPPTGKVWRVDVENQRRGKKPGWYICEEQVLDDGRRVIVGAYGIWEGAANNAQRLRIRGEKLNEFARLKLKQRQADMARAAEEAEERLLREVAAKAKAIWDKLPSCRPDAPYLQRKGVTAYGLARGRDGIVVVPARNTAGMLTQLQFINADGDKKWLTGPGKKGAYHLIGTIANELPLVFAEGYATGASIHMATAWPVVICFDANNLVEVAQRLRLIYPDLAFVFAADDDHEKKQNTGRAVVTKGAQRYGGTAVFPRFLDPAGRSDFNDVYLEQGLDAVREQLQARVTPAIPAGAQALDPEWRRELVYNRDGQLVAMAQNLMVVFENHPDWLGVWGYNQFSKRVMKLREPPFGARVGPLTDTDEIEAAAWFGRQSTFASPISSSVARQAVLAVAERHPYHPLRDWLNSLRWDGTDRLDTFFSDFCNVPQSPMSAGFARNFFIAACARVFEPGCKADLMLVLEGEQGARKSTLARVLAGPGNYADVGTAPSDKDFFQIIQGVWIVEVSEMAAFARSEASHIKRAISVDIDRFRKSYGHNVEDFPRECVFFGTANNSEWQKDETGGRRFMPLWVTDIDLDAVRLVRDQLWAEALHRYRAGEPWHVLPEGAHEAQEQRYVDDVWTQPISHWLNKRGGVDGRLRDCVTTSQVLLDALDLDLKKHDRSVQTRVGTILKRLGWSARQRRVGNARIREYVRPESAT